MDFADTARAYLLANVHIFRWNWGSLGWDYVKSGSIDGESARVPFEGTYGLSAEDNSIYRIISSDAQNIVYRGDGTLGAPGIGGRSTITGHGHRLRLLQGDGGLTAQQSLRPFASPCLARHSPKSVMAAEGFPKKEAGVPKADPGWYCLRRLA